MQARLARFSIFAALALTCAAAMPAWSGAATKYDTTYQNGGMLLLPQIRGVYGQVSQTCDVAGGKLHIAGRFGPNSPGLPGPWSTKQSLATTAVTVNKRQPMNLGIATVRWTKQRIPTGHVVLGSDFDTDGGFAYVTRSNDSKLRTKLKLFRVSPSGRRVASFGRNGYISITIQGFTAKIPYGFRVIALPERKVLLIAQTKTTQVLLRYTKTGRPDKTWGSSGVVELAAPTAYNATPLEAVDSASVTTDGGLLIGANSAPGKPDSGKFGVLKLTARGDVATGWANGGYWTPPAPKAGNTYAVVGQTLLTSLRKGGGFAVLYADATNGDVGTSSDLKVAYVDKTSGVTTLFNDTAGIYDNGGDGGFPDAEPWILAPSSSGTILGHAEGRYDSPGGSFLGQAIRFSADADQPVATRSIGNSGFAVGTFAVDPTAKFLYLCGAFGVTPKSAKDPAKREQRKAVAIKRIAL